MANLHNKQKQNCGSNKIQYATEIIYCKLGFTKLPPWITKLFELKYTFHATLASI